MPFRAGVRSPKCPGKARCQGGLWWAKGGAFGGGDQKKKRSGRWLARGARLEGGKGWRGSLRGGISREPSLTSLYPSLSRSEACEEEGVWRFLSSFGLDANEGPHFFDGPVLFSKKKAPWRDLHRHFYWEIPPADGLPNRIKVVKRSRAAQFRMCATKAIARAPLLNPAAAVRPPFKSPIKKQGSD